jgi:hypothetical protein
MSIERTQLTVGARVTVKVNGEPTEAVYVGWSDQYNMPSVRIGNRVIPRKVLSIIDGAAVEDTAVEPEITAEEVVRTAEQLRSVNERFDINRRFQFIEKIVVMIAKGPANSLIVTGQGGLGKSHTVFHQLGICNLEEDRDYVIVKGYATSKSLYRTLYNNQDRIIVFDDCDSILDDKNSLNLLKSALDTTAERHVSWLSESGRDDLPSNFMFSGKIIFISNRSLNRIDQAILSRAMYVDVTMTGSEKIDRIRAIAHMMRPDVHSTIRDEVVDFLNELRDRISDLNLRTFLKVVNVRISEPSCWKEIAEYIVTA